MTEKTMPPKEGIGIFARLLFGFIIVLIFTGSGFYYSYTQMSRLSDFTTKMYNHPLRVTRAVLSADTNIIKIHRSMKDVALAETEAEFLSAINLVNSYEKIVYQNLDTVENWILGDEGRRLQGETVQLFHSWKPIRDNVIQLTRSGGKKRAFAITRGEGARHVEILQLKMEELKEYASEKAKGMLKDSIKTRDSIYRSAVIIFSVLVLLSTIAGYFLSHRIKNSIDALMKGVEEFRAGNVNYTIKQKFKDEFSWLAQAFNTMAFERNQARIELIGHKEHLEELVKIRTEALEEQITERNKIEVQINASLKEKETLLHEIHHRVKNNLQVIISLLALQSGKFEDDRIREILQESQNKVYAMSAIHETLYSSDSFSEINLKSYVTALTEFLVQSYDSNLGKIQLFIESDEIKLAIEQANPLGLIINELLSNSLKYAFPGGRPGEIKVELKRQGENLELTIRDNGVGLPNGFDWRNSESLGLKLVTSLVENQLGGSIVLEGKKGTTVSVKFGIDPI
jgi:two-component sensor histidine kinase/HAMP domain-containing protein